MTIKSTGSLSFTEIHDEFRSLGGSFGSKPYLLSEYYDLPNGIGVPNSGEIKFSDFYGKSNIIFVTEQQWINISDTQIDSKYNRKDCDLWEALQAMGYTDPARNYNIKIPADYWLWSSTTSKGGLTVPDNLTGINVITNRGNIIGMGGKGGNSGSTGQAGGPALDVLGNGKLLTLFNYGYVAGGGGGGSGSRGAGGGGAGGGLGGSGTGTDNNGRGGAGGALNASGSNGGGGSQAGGGRGGGAGGGGGGADNESNCYNDNGAGGGGGGGRILPGVGGAGGSGESGERGGAGGSGNAVGGAPVSNAGGGGGGWGKAGGRTGGAGGAGIKSSRTMLVSNIDDGVIWGTV